MNVFRNGKCGCDTRRETMFEHWGNDIAWILLAGVLAMILARKVQV